MNARTKGLVVAALHIALVAALGGKLLADRAMRPRVWVEVAPYDPDLPIRGRYVRLQVMAEPRGFEAPAEENAWGSFAWGSLSVENDRLVATRNEQDLGLPLRIRKVDDRLVAVVNAPVAFFIPEHAEDPSPRPGLVAEVTVPRKGPPRPIRLGVREGEKITPLDL